MKHNSKGLSAAEISAFCSQLAYITRAGVPVREGIAIMSEDAEDSSSVSILKDISVELEAGRPLSEAISACGAFPKYLVNMVEIGQSAGRLEEVLSSLSAYYENREAIRRSVKNAISYPLAMIFMMAAVIIVLVLRVLPVFRQVLGQLGAEVGGLPSGIMALGDALGVAALVLVGLILIVALALALLRMNEGGRRLLSRFASHFFLTRTLSRKTVAARFASTMALMLSSGLDVDRSLDMARELVDSPEAAAKIDAMRSEISGGASFAEALSKSGIFSGIDSRMVTVGFKTGSIDSVMSGIAARTEDEISDSLGNMISIIEPTLVAILSVVVGAIILSVMLPLMGIMSTLI